VKVLVWLHLEAMACEVPVISSNAGGIAEVNIQGETGFMSNVGDYEDMAKNALYILEDAERLLQFKQNALAQAKRFDLDIILPRYERYYDQVCGSSGWMEYNI
jgi:glycosyltransferase involved in cell wall biosynthesis